MIAAALDILLVLSGLALIGAWILKPEVRARWRSPVLRAWSVKPSDFILFLIFVLAGGVGGQVLGVSLLKHTHVEAATQLVMIAGAFQFGMLAGIGVFHKVAGSRGSPPLSREPGIFVSGAATFLIALPAVTLVTVVWQSLLNALGLPVEKQELIDLFVNARWPFQRGVLILLAAGIAPVTEELIFRAGLFRYLRTRVPRSLALFVPALIFGALHVDWAKLTGLSALAPLVALGVIFSLAYERTGRIGTAIVAHALFNLNTVILILSGINL